MTTFTALSLLAVPALALAHGGDHGGRGNYDSLVKHVDKNGDGKLEVSELPPKMAEKFAAADTNRDGVITREEFEARKEALKKEHEAAMDTNHDGTVSTEERAAARTAREKEHFAKLDKNGDGQLAQSEVPAEMWSHISAADTDKSGTVSFAEMQAFMASHGRHHDAH
jgi:Ca2+-binding EF-hand superfamily protein